ncbi:LCP family protein [Nocardia sp. NBC_00565]|uniref:LCP family protein n=1 Tax=Nocardia sp. NBC_00565 TaxID=2975993 RepID=UPI002E808E0B|nr:LCP family protein [Nocardia sp. NBC_00565]WUC02612.1 LCP family protein [Nocardia sp. NBC_00565]
MGDDRHGQSPRPGGRAPWERYPTADNTDRDGARSSRRARHTDPESGSAPLTVQDLVQKVDNERSGRKRRPSTTPDSAAPPTSANRRAEPAPKPSEPPRQPDAPARSPSTGSARKTDTPPRPSSPAKKADARPAGPARRPASSPVVDDIAGTPTSARPATKRRTATGSAAAKEPPEVVTDVITPVADTPRTKKRANGWPTTDSDAAESAAPSTRVGMSRLAASRQRRNKRLRLAGRISMTICAVIALLVTGGGWSYLRSTANGFTQVSALDDHPEDVLDSGAQLGDENYLLVGTDTRAGVNSQLGAGTLDDAEGSRADTVMLVNIPKNRSRVVVVSFPRDLDVTRPQCNGWDNDKAEYTNEVFPSAMGDKLNAVYALAGPKCLVNVIRKMTGLSIGHFIGIDFAGFEAMVDQVGGVDVCTPKPIVDGILGTVLENPGPQRINGATALNYVRARHVYGEERSDYDRINRQQRFLASLLRGALSGRVLFDPGKLNGFISAFTSHTFVDKVQPTDLLTLGRSLQKVDAGAVTFLTIPTAGTTSYGNEIPRESDIKAIFRAVIDDQPLPGEKKSTPAPGSIPSSQPAPPKLIAVDPSTVSLLVSNGSETAGAANKAATKLGNQGFQIYNTGNYSGGNTEVATKVRFGTGHEAEAATVASALPGASLEQASTLGGIVEVVIGADGGTVRAPTPVGDPISNVPSITSASEAPVTLPSDLEHVNAADDTCK